MDDSIANGTYVIKAFFGFVFKGLIEESMQDIAC